MLVVRTNLQYRPTNGNHVTTRRQRESNKTTTTAISSVISRYNTATNVSTKIGTNATLRNWITQPDG
eukprot:4827387-Amphidinium_carterae.1